MRFKKKCVSKQPPAEPVALEEPPKRGLLKRLRV